MSVLSLYGTHGDGKKIRGLSGYSGKGWTSRTRRIFKNENTLHGIIMMYMSLCSALIIKSCPTLVTPWTVARQAPLSMGFSRQEHWSGLSFPSPEDLPNPGIEPRSPALQADSLLTELWEKPICLSIAKEYSTPVVKPQVNYELWVIMMYQCRFILGNKCTTLLNNIENGGSCVCVGTGAISVLSSHLLFVNLKLLFKKDKYKQNNES